ncbi:MAG: hypothetical protein E7269_07805 [Lachnospiraceae bacterium]|nr:hypothetical protein [Lachnospiraceae bacterium]
MRLINNISGHTPDFVENPRFTPNGKPWVNVTNVGCPYAEKDFDDCGSCRFFRQERPGDLIGICENEHYCGKIPFVER